ncbi:MAG: sodium:solute symporter [Oscillospiraceae bacterium]|jgi:SSS family solute:Na+ symporter|nr:sodium:solute symporter [Oscillospiraceae bacterium]
MSIILIMLVAFCAITVVIGFISSKKNDSVAGFVLGGRSIGPWLTAFAYGTSYFSAVMFVGYAGQFGWKFGIASTWIGLGTAFIGSTMAWVILARRTRLMTRRLNSATTPDFFGSRFNSKNLKLAASAITFVFLIPYTASLYNGLSRLFAMAFNVDFTVAIVVMAVITGIYVIAGGYKATVMNDLVQGVIMIAGTIAIIAAVLRVNGGFMNSLAALSQVTDDTVSTNPGAFASFFGPNPVDLLGVTLLTSLGTWGLPQMVQKFYSIKSEKNIITGTVVSTVFAIIISGGSFFIGGFGRLWNVDIAAQGYDAVMPTMLSGFSPVMLGVVITLVFAASISTLSSLVMTSSSTLTLDFLKDRFVKNMDEKRQLRYIRAFIAAFVVLSSGIAIFQHKSMVTFIAQMMGISWGALAGAFLAPFLYSLYWKRTTKYAVAANYIFAVGIMLLNVFTKSVFPTVLKSPINLGAFTMLAGLIIVPLVSLVTKKPDADLVSHCFGVLDEIAPAPKKEYLEDAS